MSKAVVIYSLYEHLGYAFYQAQPDGSALYLDPADNTFKGFDPKFVRPFPPQSPPPNAALRVAPVPPGLPACGVSLYELAEDGAPVAVFDGATVNDAPPPAPRRAPGGIGHVIIFN